MDRYWLKPTKTRGMVGTIVQRYRLTTITYTKGYMLIINRIMNAGEIMAQPKRFRTTPSVPPPLVSNLPAISLNLS